MGVPCVSHNQAGNCSQNRAVLLRPQVDSDTYVEPECSCGRNFCFRCAKDPHSPCTCKMWELWDEKISGDSETKNWMAINTKPCPKCSKAVEKNGGCNLVVCTCGQVSVRKRMRRLQDRILQVPASAACGLWLSAQACSSALPRLQTVGVCVCDVPSANVSCVAAPAGVLLAVWRCHRPRAHVEQHREPLLWAVQG